MKASWIQYIKQISRVMLIKVYMWNFHKDGACSHLYSLSLSSIFSLQCIAVSPQDTN